jgi:outer membrane protein assembly factor BamD
MNKLTTYGVFATLIILMAGCSVFNSKDKTDEEREKARLLSEQQLYERVQEYFDDERFDLAVKNLQLLESRFPFGVYADQSQLEIVYAYYRDNNEDAAIAAADRFLRLHPRHPDADYAWYMKGLANYSLTPGLLSRFHQADQSARDVASARRSFREFQEFLRRYPDSVYAADARIRMVNIKDVLARHEMVVANYYVKRRAYTAAINRAKAVVEHLPY